MNFTMFWKVKKKSELDSDKRIDEIINILFPPLETKTSIGGSGEVFKYQVDYSADSNLDAALIDLREGHNDEVVRNTITKVIDKLNQVRRLLEAYSEIDSEAKYLVVDSGDSNAEDIEPIEDR